MRYLVRFMVLFTLLSTQVLANDTQLVELVVFRQSSDTLTLGQKVQPLPARRCNAAPTWVT